MKQSSQNVSDILSEIASKKEVLLKELIDIAKIPSPTGYEQKKIQFIKERVQKYGIKDVSIDIVGNCIAKLPSKSTTKKKKNILVVAHVDTACDPGKKVVIAEDKKYIYGHGVCDNSAGIVGLLTTISLIKSHNIVFPHNLIFGFTVGEEGLGAKRGMKQIIKEYGKQIDAVINAESHHIGRVTNQAVGQYRCSLLINTKVGGHSFRDFGRPNSNVILAQIISDFSYIKLPQTKGKTTFNFGQMEGEGSINSISQNASCLFEIRSENNGYLQKAKESFESILNKYRRQLPNTEIRTVVSAEVPAVIFSATHRIYKLTMAVQRQLGITSQINAGNTDGDVSLAKGIPTVTIGISEGWNTHSLSEYVEKKSLPIGVKQAFMLVYVIASSY